MKKPKILFLCSFSNSVIRDKLYLRSYNTINRLLRFLKKSIIQYSDYAIWVDDYISEFEGHPEFDFYILSPHKGMKKQYQQFIINRIHYSFFKCDDAFLIDYVKSYFKLEEKTNFSKTRGIIQSIINTISPDLVILCGAENPVYSISVLDIHTIPIYVIPQTLLNDAKRISMGVGSPYRRKIELKIFRHANYYCTSEEKTVKRIREENSNAVFLPAGFPTHRPIVTMLEKKDYDFVFFARSVSKHKGIEDLLHAFAVVLQKHNDSSLNIIGSCLADYRLLLENLIEDLSIRDNVHFSGYFEQISDAYNCVAKGKVVVVPGITAALNSTVREAMFIGLPTICYETIATSSINEEKQCLLTAPMGDVNALAEQMLYAIERPEKAKEIANNGKEYAEEFFGNKAIVNQLLYNCKQIIDKQV